MPGKGDRRIWTRYTDLEPSAGKITQFLKAAEGIGEDSRSTNVEKVVTLSLFVFVKRRSFMKDWQLENEK